MTGAKVIVVGDGDRTGFRIAEDTGTAPPFDPNSTCTISFGVFSDSSARKAPDRKEEDAEKEGREQERVRKMREGWKDIRKGHERGRGGAMRRGFTLIELLVSVAIVALVMLLGWTGYNGVKERGKKELRAEAARMGVARWTVTNEQGDAEFRWNSPKAPGNPVDLETGALAYMRATNEFGVLEVRWTPPTPLLGTPTTNMAGEWKAADTNEGCLNYGSKLENLKLGPEGYILKLKDAKTGKEIEVLIPMYTNPTFLLDYGSTTIPLGGGAAGGRPRR